MSEVYHDNPGLESLVKDYSDSELLRTRVTLIRQISRLNDFLGIVDYERASRAPETEDAVVLDLIPRQRDSEESLVREDV